MSHSPYACYEAYLQSIEALGLKRALGAIEAPLIDFSHNDYLGFRMNDPIAQAWQNALTEKKLGSRGSRLLSGNDEAIEKLEATIASDCGKEAALVFSSGYQANSEVIAALLDRKILGIDPIVLSDRLNHASMHAGCQAAGVRQKRYRHLELNHLEDQLKQAHASRAPKWILTESVFSMEGDCIDAEGLLDLAKRYQALLYVDEAHAIGVMGEKGLGLLGNQAFEGVLMGTFSKALGLMGGYVACDQSLKNYLINRCKGFIYSTALPPPLVAALQKAWEIAIQSNGARANLVKLNRAFQNRRLQDYEVPKSAFQTPIIPWIMRGNDQALALGRHLRENGIAVAVIRSPTVPQGTERLRFSLSADHQLSEIDQLFEALASFKDGL